MEAFAPAFAKDKPWASFNRNEAVGITLDRYGLAMRSVFEASDRSPDGVWEHLEKNFKNLLQRGGALLVSALRFALKATDSII